MTIYISNHAFLFKLILSNINLVIHALKLFSCYIFPIILLPTFLCPHILNVFLAEILFSTEQVTFHKYVAKKFTQSQEIYISITQRKKYNSIITL